MKNIKLTNYDHEATNFAKLPEYSIHCGTDYLAVKDVPEKIKQLQSINKILDLGCGSGLATRYLKKHFPNALVVGADINNNMLEQAITADPEGLYLHLPQLNDQVSYPFLPNYFDVVICSFVLHENRTLEELTIFLANIAKVLCSGGMLLAWDVYKNLFHGNWLSIKNISSTTSINEGEQYTVKILPANAEVTGTYWDPETLANIVKSLGLKSNTTYPLVEKNNEINWLDEIKLAPYFLFEAIKG